MPISRSPDDLYDLSYIQDGDKLEAALSRSQPASPYQELSQNTAALTGPAGCLTPSPMSRTRDGKSRIMDLNNLGLHGGVPQRQPTPVQDNFPAKWKDSVHSAGQRERPFDYPRNDRVAALQAGFAAPQQAVAWRRQEQRQRVAESLNKIHQASLREARGTYLPHDPDMLQQYRRTANIPRPIEPVPPRSPTDWEQDKVLRSHRITDRNQQDYLDELRWADTPAKQPVNDVYTDQMRLRMQIRQQFEEDQLRQDRQSVRQEMFRPVAPNAAPAYPAPPPHRLRQQPNNLPNTYNQVPLTEVELDEKRQLMVQKRTKGTKEVKENKAKTKSKVAMKERQNESSEPSGQEAGHLMVPHRPTAPPKDKENDNESYSKRKRKLIGKSQASNAEATIDDGCSKGYAPSICSDETKSQRGSQKYYGSGSVYYGVESSGCSTGTRVGKEVTDSTPHPPIIPRQTSQQNIFWNSDIAKRGLGFKSRQRREAEEETEEVMSVESRHGYITPDMRQKWKKTTFF